MNYNRRPNVCSGYVRLLLSLFLIYELGHDKTAFSNINVLVRNVIHISLSHLQINSIAANSIVHLYCLQVASVLKLNMIIITIQWSKKQMLDMISILIYT